MLKQQSAHTASTNNRDLFSLEGYQLVKPLGLPELELSEFDSSRAD
jgi:hypothetical protein